MRRRIPLLLALVLCVAAPARANWADAVNRDDWQVATYVDWDGVASRDRIYVFAPPVLNMDGRPERTWRLDFPWFAPMCVTWERWPGRLYSPSLSPAIVIRKPRDKASPVLRNADRTKRLLKRVVMRVRDATGGYRALALTDARVGCFTTFSPNIGPTAIEDDFIVLVYRTARLLPVP